MFASQARRWREQREERWDKEDAGEGSRGGHIIGRTKGGKPIYMNHNHPSHEGFGTMEHLAAVGVHNRASADLKSKKEQLKKEGKGVAASRKKITGHEALKTHRELDADIKSHAVAVAWHGRKAKKFK